MSGLTGQAVAARLSRDNPFARVFGVDRRPPRILGPVHYIAADLTEVDLGDLCVINSVDVILHLAGGPPREVILAARSLLEAAGLAAVRRVVFASWDQVYGGADAPRTEAAPLRSEEGAPAALLARLRVERMLAVHQEAYPDSEVVVVRTCPVIGPGRGMPLDHLLEMPVVLAPAGRDPLVQLLHVDDAAEAFVRAASRPGVRGAFNVAGLDPICLSVLAGVLEKRVVPLPRLAARGAAQAGQKLRLMGFGPDDLRMLHDGVPLAMERTPAELDFAPRYSTRQTLAVWRTRYDCEKSWSRP